MDFLPFARPTIDEAMIAAVADTLRGRWIASGPQVQSFEAKLSEYVGGRPVRTLTSATAAMQIALEIIGVGPGDEVVTPAQSFFATANVIERTGATTVFVDVNLASRNMDFAQAEAAITPRTRVLLPTHYNAPLDTEVLGSLAKRRGLRVIEDAALAIGSRTGAGPVGATGDLVSFSFHPNKNLTTIEGGALVVNDADEARRVEELRFHGIRRNADGTRDVPQPGSKYNMSDVSARLGIEQLRHLDEWCRARERLAFHYFKCLEGEELFPREALPPRDNPGHSWNMFTVLLPLEATRTTRKHFMDAMQKEGIGIGISYEAIHLASYFRGKGFREGQFPVSERIARETVTLPLYPEMRETDVERVVESMKRVLRRKAAYMAAPNLSVVIPVYNEEEVLPALFARLYPALDALGVTYEIVFVNDGSRDRSAALLREQFQKRPEVTRVILFNGNFGQHMAIMAGFEHVRGERVVTLDADLQNPPEEIGKLLAKMDEGHDYVGSIRRLRQDAAWRRWASKATNRMRERITRIRMTDQGCMLRAYDRPIVDAIRASREVSTFIPALAYSFARNPTEVEVEHEERHAGESKYSLYKLVRLNFDLVTGFSVLPLQLFSLFGIFVALVSIGVYVVVIFKRIVAGEGDGLWVIWDRDILEFFLTGVMLFGLGLIGEYVGRIYQQVRERPRYLIQAILERPE